MKTLASFLVVLLLSSCGNNKAQTEQELTAVKNNLQHVETRIESLKSIRASQQSADPRAYNPANYQEVSMQSIDSTMVVLENERSVYQKRVDSLEVQLKKY